MDGCDSNPCWIENGQCRATCRSVMRFEEGTLVTRVRLRHPTLGLTLEFADTVDFHECLLVRRCRVTNEKQRERAVRIFFHHDFHISGTEVGDTAYY